MKIRTKISLWITAAGVLVSLIFSLIIFWEMVEQNYNQLDDELKATTRNVFKIVQQDEVEGAKHSSLAATVFLDGQRYWIRVWRADTLIYASRLARIIDLPIDPDKKKDTLSVTIPREKIDLDQDRFDEVSFRVRSIKISTHKAPPGYRIQVALPMEELDEEIVEVSLIIIFGLLFSTLLLIVISYFLAGRILKPVKQITYLARDINGKELADRIPLGSSRDELYDLSFELNQMLDRLQYSFKRQKEFIASAAHELKKVFEQFYRVEKSRSLEFGGCGLGLTIVREIVNLHGGKVDMENDPSGRVQVVVQLPDGDQEAVGTITF